MIKNGQGYLLTYTKRHFSGWSDFKRECGYSDNPFFSFRTKKIALKEYEEIRKKYGNKAKSSGWVATNIGEGFIKYIYNNFKSWNEFKSQAGFNESPLHISWSKEKIIEEYKRIRLLHGDKAKSSNWLVKNGYAGLKCNSEKYGRWDEFKKMAGFYEVPLNQTWTVDFVLKKYAKIATRHADKVKSCLWMINNEGRLFAAIYRMFGSWKKFLDFYEFSYKISDKELRINI